MCLELKREIDKVTMQVRELENQIHGWIDSHGDGQRTTSQNARDGEVDWFKRWMEKERESLWTMVNGLVGNRSQPGVCWCGAWVWPGGPTGFTSSFVPYPHATYPSEFRGGDSSKDIGMDGDGPQGSRQEKLGEKTWSDGETELLRGIEKAQAQANHRVNMEIREAAAVARADF